MKCEYCERACTIPEHENGFCNMYRSDQGKIVENFPDMYLNIYPVSSESIPLLHFYPNNVFLLVSTIGCNFVCEGCVSQFQTTRKGSLQEILTPHTPEEILSLAREGQCRGITFCLNEPTVSLPTFLRVARAAKKEGLLVGCSSNGYMTHEALQTMIPYLDFVNIGLKGSSEERYNECGVPSPAPVIRNIRTLFNAGVAIEISAMYLQGRDAEMIGAAKYIHELSPEIPFQVMRFMAFHENLIGIEPTRQEGEQLCNELRKYLNHVYLFNTPATTELDSRCPSCGSVIIHRVFYGPMAARILSSRPNGICSCGYRFTCRGDIAPVSEGDPKNLGGYRSIFGVRFVVELLTALGVTDNDAVDRICNLVIANGYLSNLPNHVGSMDAYFGMIRYIAELAHREEQGRRLSEFMQSKITEIRDKVSGAKRLRTLAVLSHPLIPLYGVKLENTLIETAGGTSLNRELRLEERKKPEYTVEEFNRLDPEVILISGHFATPVADFLKTCRDLGITCKAISTDQVYTLNTAYVPGTPRWILGLLEIANILHPERFRYVMADEEAQYFRVIQTPAP